MASKRDPKAGGKSLTRVGDVIKQNELFLEPTNPRKIEVATDIQTAQGQHHFTRSKQVDALLKIGQDSNPDIGFMNRLLALCSLPRTDPGDQLQYKRQNGPYKLILVAGGDNKLPYGNLPRLLLAWICTEVVQKRERRIVLGDSLAEFMQKLGINNDSGGIRSDRTRLKNQIDRLFSCSIQLIMETEERKRAQPHPITDDYDLWWSYKEPNQLTLQKSWIEIGHRLFDDIINNPVPIDMNILRKMKRSTLGLDLYMWLSYKTYSLYSQGKKPERLTWRHLYIQFGADPSRADDYSAVRDFRTDALRELKKLKLAWPTLDYSTPTGVLVVSPCMPSIRPKLLTTG